MSEAPSASEGPPKRPRVPIRGGYFTIPEDEDASPRLLGTRCLDCGESFFPRRARSA